MYEANMIFTTLCITKYSHTTLFNKYGSRRKPALSRITVQLSLIVFKAPSFLLTTKIQRGRKDVKLWDKFIERCFKRIHISIQISVHIKRTEA